MGKSLIIPGADFSANAIKRISHHIEICDLDPNNIITENSTQTPQNDNFIAYWTRPINTPKGKLKSLTLKASVNRTPRVCIIECELPNIPEQGEYIEITNFRILYETTLIQDESNPLKFYSPIELDFSEQNKHFAVADFRYETDGYSTYDMALYRRNENILRVSNHKNSFGYIIEVEVYDNNSLIS